MRFIFVILALTFFPCINASDITNYFQDYRKTNVSNYSVEQELIHNNELEILIKKLTPFYSDTLTNIRQKAYYLTYKKGVSSKSLQVLAIKKLISGCNDKDGGIIGQNVEYLKAFRLENFDKEAEQLINLKLSNHRVQHYKDFVLLAGFIGTGKDILFQKFLDQNIPDKTKWYLALALSRMGSAEQIAFCMEKVKKLPLNDNLLDYIIPDLIYMRQKEGIDFCITILNNNEKLCHSLNPDYSENILCAYRIIEMLAPVIVDIPVVLDASGSVRTKNYENELNKVRKWFSDNPKYQLKMDTF